MASLWKQAEDPLAAALYGLQLEDGEFRCPACRSLGNTVLPLSPRNRSKQTVSTAAIPHLTEQQLSGWVLRRLGVAASLSVSPSAPEGPIMSFLMRAVGAREMLQSEEVSLRPNHLPFPAVLHQIVSTMCSSAELASRGRPDALFTYPHRVLIERVLNAARQSTTASQRASVLSVLVPVLIPMVSNEQQNIITLWTSCNRKTSFLASVESAKQISPSPQSRPVHCSRSLDTCARLHRRSGISSRYRISQCTHYHSDGSNAYLRYTTVRYDG